MAKISESKLLKGIKEYFWVEAHEIKALLKVLSDSNNDTEKLILSEQFNIWFNEWLKSAFSNLDKVLKENVKQPIQDFKEVDPTANVKNINQETNDQDKHNETRSWTNSDEKKDNLSKS